MTKRLLKIVTALLVMALLVFSGGQILRPKSSASGPSETAHNFLASLPDRSPAPQPDAPNLAPTMLAAPGVSTRSLASYYSRRAYSGAPPSIPHPVDVATNRDQRCNICHEKGGFTPKFNAYVPVTPHPSYANCMQCHVVDTSAPLFAQSQWQSTPPPSIRHPALPGSPPPIPHSLALRDNCLACHSGPAAVAEIRCSHPQRLSCRQCHAAQQGLSPFARPAGTE